MAVKRPSGAGDIAADAGDDTWPLFRRAVSSGNASSVNPIRALAAPRAVIEGHNSTGSLHERHERISTVGYCDVVDWQRHLTDGLAPATVNNHPASLSGFTTWVSAQARAVRDR